MKQRILKVLSVVLLLSILATTVFADDGEIFRKNVSGTPQYDTEYVSLRMLPVFVPPQASDGTVLESIDYYNADGTIDETVASVQPLIMSYQDGPVTHIEEYEAFPGHGARDSYVAVSLDGGATWKRTNVSNSAKRSSIKINRKPYPGDTLRNFLASDGNKVLFVWASKYCGSGSPAYSMEDDERLALATYLEGTGTISDANACTDGDLSTPCPYLEDAFGVAGSQGVQSAKDLADDGYPLVGDYPYSCLWAARGTLLPPTAEGESSTFVWFNAERLSSGVRSAERAEVQCVKGAGCAVTWQEDPEGVRPGEGDGPGEGWSGAVAHHQTDTWYSYIDWDDFDLVSLDGTYGSFNVDPTTALSGESLATWVAVNSSGSPKVAVPMSIPMRVTDNAMCTAMTGTDLNLESKPYCYIDFDDSGTADFCASTVTVPIETPEGPTQDVEMCVAEDGRLMRGNTASTRARLSLHGYSTLGDYKADPAAYPINSAWVSFSYEENKGLGDVCDDGYCDDSLITDADKKDMGKNIWYHTFDMFNPEFVSQGMMINQPEVYPTDWDDPTGLLTNETSLGYNFWTFTEDPIYNTLAGITTTTLYQSEIARRASQVTQDWYDAGSQGLVAFNLWKQGIVRRGGPADAMGRRWVIPDDFDSATDNPYDYYNMVCENADGSSGWAYVPEEGALPENARYTKGFCAAPAINLSANTILEGECGDATTCFDVFPFNDYFDDLDMTDSEGISKITSWTQYGPSLGEDFDTTFEDDPETSFDDQSWTNPYDMAKGHRGFLAGDNVMIMYAWTNNWSALTEAHDIVNLYARRSFDGGQTFTTLPASYTHTNGITYSGDGTTSCEFQGETGTATELPVCYTYAAGEFEQSRDLSLLTGSTVTVLDPRYAPTSRSVTTTSVSTASLPAGFIAPDCTSIVQDECDNMRDPSRFHMVYETGITSAYDEGEAEALDLFYSRAVDWGDDYLVWAEEDDTSACLPDADAESALTGTGVCNEFDGLESSKFSTASEGSLVSSPGAKFLYAGWFQEDFDIRTGEEIGIDAWYRRIMYIANYIPGIDPPEPNNEPPGLSIDDPANGAEFSINDTIAFNATALDLEDGDLSESVVWQDNGTLLGTGAALMATLDEGSHLITATITDSGALNASAQITITVVDDTPLPPTPTPLPPTPTPTPLPPTPTPPPSTGQLVLDAATSQDIYKKGDTLRITVKVSDENGSGVGGAAVTALINFPKINITLSGVSDANGLATLSYKINTVKTGTGPVLITLNAAKEGFNSVETALWIEVR